MEAPLHSPLRGRAGGMKRELPRGVTKRELRNEKRWKGIAVHFHVGSTAVVMACRRAEVRVRRAIFRRAGLPTAGIIDI